jgi:hypothetical protein
MQVIFHSDTSQVYEVTRRLLYVRIGASVSRRLGECKISRQEKSAMLTETAVQNGFSEHPFGRAMREKRSAGAPAPGGSVERMGTPMSFGRDVEIYGGRGARRLSLQDHPRGSTHLQGAHRRLTPDRSLLSAGRHIRSGNRGGARILGGDGRRFESSGHQAQHRRLPRDMGLRRGSPAVDSYRPRAATHAKSCPFAHQDRAATGGQLPARNGRAHPGQR